MRKSYSFETSFVSLRDELRAFLKGNNIYYELSDASGRGFRCYHFQIVCNAAEAKSVNAFLDSVTVGEE